MPVPATRRRHLSGDIPSATHDSPPWAVATGGASTLSGQSRHGKVAPTMSRLAAVARDLYRAGGGYFLENLEDEVITEHGGNVTNDETRGASGIDNMADVGGTDDMASLTNNLHDYPVTRSEDYGAKGDGKTDSTKAFEEAWNAACSTKGKPRIFIPKGQYLVGPLMFKGPCKSGMVLKVKGQVVASTNLNIYKMNWIEFQYIDGLVISGGGRFNGQGASAWPHNECKKKRNCKVPPMSLVFSFVTNATISKISSIDSKFFHMHVFASKNMKFKFIKIIAPESSPNTDGIHIAESSNIKVIDSIIHTGDDCISIGPGSHNLLIARVFCGPGHGISIGSLGKYANEKDVVGLKVNNCTLSGTDNGLRIKTWQSSPSFLKVTDFIFEDIIMKNVYNPIIIDQEYCPFEHCAEKDPSLVKIKNIKFKNIKGTSTSEVAIKLKCSDSHPCEGVELSNINLKYNGENKNAITMSTCVNAHVISNGNVNPKSCI
ncbi:hypothetical protein Cni_G06724 [Canna indica]|uniref:Exopolygalacturonase n=1 Tax=Canna indica TaxID=4628 RepID=A0AAQ3JXR6_9LILI|nr:hypothetical protein Cni_G06724 [Canna indica]